MTNNVKTEKFRGILFPRSFHILCKYLYTAQKEYAATEKNVVVAELFPGLLCQTLFSAAFFETCKAISDTTQLWPIVDCKHKNGYFLYS